MDAKFWELRYADCIKPTCLFPFRYNFIHGVSICFLDGAFVNIDMVQGHILNDVMCYLDETAKNASTKLLESYKRWVDAMHSYRHGQDVDSYDNPPADFAILALSNGASYLRWLASMVQSKAEKGQSQHE